MRIETTTYVCDGCGDVSDRPTAEEEGWSSVSMSPKGKGSGLRFFDLCPACSSVVRDILTCHERACKEAGDGE